MPLWPVPNSPTKRVPESGPGSFYEDRGDRRHTGVDIYAPAGSEVVATELGTVVAKDLFTSPAQIPYWLNTYFVAIRGASGVTNKYCELGEVNVKIGDTVEAGEMIGVIGNVLDFEKIDSSAPGYIQQIKAEGSASMLHFEQYSAEPIILENYLGGNLFGEEKPANPLDPTEYLKSTLN